MSEKLKAYMNANDANGDTKRPLNFLHNTDELPAWSNNSNTLSCTEKYVLNTV